VLAFEVGTAERRWAAARHPLFDFIFRTFHPELGVPQEELRSLAEISGSQREPVCEPSIAVP
jgi:hypothetical protein